MKAVHSALYASIYRLPNIGPYFNNYVEDPQNSGPNWMLCHNKKRYVAINFSVFVIGLYRSIQFSIATCSLSFFFGFCRNKFFSVDPAILFLSQHKCLVSRHRNLLHLSLYTLMPLKTIAT